MVMAGGTLPLRYSCNLHCGRLCLWHNLIRNQKIYVVMKEGVIGNSVYILCELIEIKLLVISDLDITQDTYIVCTIIWPG